MKQLLIGALGAMALAAASPAYAAGGYVGAAYERVEVDVTGAEEADGYSVTGALAFDPTATLGAEIDGGVVDFDDVDASYGVNGHLYADTGMYKFGAFAGISDSDDTDAFWSVGVEGAAHLTAVTLVGALGYGEGDDYEETAIDAQARFFATDNLRLQGNIGYSDSEFEGGGSFDETRYGVGAEYQFDAAPVSIFAAYNRFDADDIEADGIRVGARWNFGNGTLRDRDMMGPTFTGVSSLGNFGSAFIG